ncbi:hypothetical protein CP973_08175 [Streptomyces albofaciens JCM 4342]|nr:hypothetical protein CP973_08175 [Streptomyces albofaciens JCM 4342]
MLFGDLDRDVQKQEAEGGGAEGPVHPLGEEPAARQQDRTACCDQSPDDGGREGHEGQYAAGEVEEGAQRVGTGKQEERQSGGGSGDERGAAARAGTAWGLDRKRVWRGGGAWAAPGPWAVKPEGRPERARCMETGQGQAGPG